MTSKAARLACVALVAAVAMGCSELEKLMPGGEADRAPVHTQHGFRLLDHDNNPVEALREFDRAIALDPNYSLAHAGRGTALGLMGKAEEAFEALDEAEDLARNPREELEVGVGLVRVHTALKGEDWLDEAEEAFEDYQDQATETQTARLHRFMGEAYLQGGKLGQAEDVLVAGLELEDHPPARAVLKRVQEARGALAGMPEEYLAVATTPRINRADVAAIFVAELQLDKLLEARGFDMTEGFATPEGRQRSTVRTGGPIGVVDIGGHWAEPFIRKMLDYQVMEAVDNRFDPDKEITKAEFALLLDGIITKVTGESATKGLGQQIFRDIGPDHWCASACVTVSTRGFLLARPDGKFGVMDPVPGSTAIESVRKIRDFFQNRYTW